LFEEPARVPAEAPDRAEETGEQARNARDRRLSKDRSSRARRGRRPSDPSQLRERLREESGAQDLSDRDYEIMSMMADGIRPILDRLDEIDNRVAQMEEGDAPVPSNPRGWLTHELADSLGDNRIATMGRGGTASELEARLPEMIEEAVTRRFNQMAGKLQQEIEETHVRTLETFVKNIQVKLVQRVSALEQDMSKQAEAMHQLKEYSQRTEDNLSRLISGVDKLAHELPKRLAAAQQETAAAQAAAEQPRTVSAEEPVRFNREPPPVREATAAPVSPKPLRRKQKTGKGAKRLILALGVTAAILGLGTWGAVHFFSNAAEASPGDLPLPPSAQSSGGKAKRAALPANADIKTKLQAAQQYSDTRDYALAEDIYKHIVADDPNNVDALKGLASVLYREGKVDESADILDKIPRQ
jgi:tetratricopeptide (TPR) repeat protein